MRRILRSILFFLTRCVVRKYEPIVIGVTGSYGKTSSKEALHLVCHEKYSVRSTRNNMNNEFGVPITVIGAADPEGTLYGWLGVILRGVRLCLFKDVSYPKVLVLEMGADRKGDISLLVKLTPCHLGILTSVGVSHLEYFETVESLQKEKEHIITHLGSDDFAILNRDDERAWGARSRTQARVISYGLDEDSIVSAREIRYRSSPKSLGVVFKLQYRDSAIPVHLEGVVGQTSVYAALSAAAAGIALGMNLVAISEALSGYRTLPGRLHMLKGIKGTYILDDTYNASPEAVLEALQVISRIECSGARWVVLGDMCELGSVSEESHALIGEEIHQGEVDNLVVVGELAMDILSAARKAGFPEERSFNFDSSMDAGKFLQDRIHEGDVILIKGSACMRMERAVKEIMGEPSKAQELLVRQDASWAR